MYVRGYLQGSENGRVVTIDYNSQNCEYSGSKTMSLPVKFLGYTNVLKIDLKCPEKYIKAYIFFIIQWIEFKFENLKYISIYVTII
jgi:hypothetical protein